MLCVVWDYLSSKLKYKKYKQKTSTKSYQTQFKILANPGLAWSDFEQPGPGRRKAKQTKNNGDREQASNWERTEVKWRFIELLSDGSQICLKTSELQVQTWQFEMTVHADERKFGGYVLIKNLPVNAILSDTV